MNTHLNLFYILGSWCLHIYKNSLIEELDVRMIMIWIPLVLITFSALVVVVVATVAASNHTSVLIKIISSSIRIYSRKKQPGATGSGWTSSNETVNYLSYSRHAGFAVSWKTHVTCSIRTEKNAYPTAVTSSWVLSFKILIFIIDILKFRIKSSE